MVGAMGLDGKPKGVEAFPESDQGRLKEVGRDISAKLAQINRGAVRGASLAWCPPNENWPVDSG